MPYSQRDDIITIWCLHSQSPDSPTCSRCISDNTYDPACSMEKCKESLKQKEISRKLVHLSSTCLSSLSSVSFCHCTVNLSLPIEYVILSSITWGLVTHFKDVLRPHHPPWMASSVSSLVSRLPALSWLADKTRSWAGVGIILGSPVGAECLTSSHPSSLLGTRKAAWPPLSPQILPLCRRRAVSHYLEGFPGGYMVSPGLRVTPLLGSSSQS